jgi:hypothetical protein
MDSYGLDGQDVDRMGSDRVEKDRPMKKIVVRRTEPIKVTSAPLNHQPVTATA